MPGRQLCLSKCGSSPYCLDVLSEVSMVNQFQGLPESFWVVQFLNLRSFLQDGGFCFPFKYPVSWASMHIECFYLRGHAIQHLGILRALILCNFAGVRKSALYILWDRCVVQAMMSWEWSLPFSGKPYLPYLLRIAFRGMPVTSLGTTFGCWGGQAEVIELGSNHFCSLNHIASPCFSL